MGKYRLHSDTDFAVAKDHEEAVRFYRMAANQAHAEGRFNLGQCYYYGHVVARDVRENLRSQCLQQAKTCLRRSTFWVSETFERQRLRFIRLARAADQGPAPAQYMLGYCHGLGTGGLAKADAEITRLFRPAAD